MKRIDTILPGVCLLEPTVFGDQRGFFMESYNRTTFSGLGIDCDFVQDNHSRSRGNVLRGLHYQLKQAQDKLVRVTRGEVFDVAVDIRVGSPTYGQWVGEILSETNQRMLFVPKGYAHGFYVISEMAEFHYKVSDFYAPEHERGVIWNDPELNIAWPTNNQSPLLSEKDAAYDVLSQLSDDNKPPLIADAVKNSP